MIKNLSLATLFGLSFNFSPALAQVVYTKQAPPSSMTGIIHQGTWWWFDNSGDPRGKRFPNGGNYVNSGHAPRRISNNVIYINGVYACKNVPFEYGRCTKSGWIRDRVQF